MLSTFIARHAENHILYACGLRRWPVNTSHTRAPWNSSHIDNEVSDLPPKDIGRAVTQPAISPIWIGVYHTEASKVCGGKQDGQAIRISNNHSIVVLNDRGGDNVGSGWKVDNGWGYRSRWARPWSASAAEANGIVYCRRVISDSVAWNISA